jgi:anti-anti-sigma factor
MSSTAIAPTPVLKLRTEKTPTQVTVRCSGRFVSDTCEQLRGTVRALIPTTNLLILDLTNVDFFDSPALGTIVGLYLSSKRAKCQLKLINLSPPIEEVLRMWPEDAFEQIDRLPR